MSIATQPETALSHLAGHDLVTVITIDRETPWRPRSPLDVPRVPRQVGGMPVRLMPLAELIEYNLTAMRTSGRFWRLCPEMLDAQLGHRDAAGDRSPSTDAETGDNGRERTTEASAADTGDGRGDRDGTCGSAAGDSVGAAGWRPSPETLELLHRAVDQLAREIIDQAAAIASTRMSQEGGQS